MQQKSNFTRLTQQLFLPKLRLTGYMQVASRQTCLLILLFGAVFLASQLHYCCELTVTPSASHVCPLCSTASSVVTTQSPAIAMVPVTNRLELTPLVILASSEDPPAASPRAPPAL